MVWYDMEWSSMVRLDPGKQHSKGAARWFSSCQLLPGSSCKSAPLINCRKLLSHCCSQPQCTAVEPVQWAAAASRWLWEIQTMASEGLQHRRLLMVRKRKENVLLQNQLAIHEDINFWLGCQNYSDADLSIEFTSFSFPSIKTEVGKFTRIYRKVFYCSETVWQTLIKLCSENKQASWQTSKLHLQF